MELSSATLPGIALTLIHTGRAPTRSALTRQLGVTRATVGAVTGELRDLGLIEVDTGAGGGHQGRPSHRLLPDPAGPVALAVQVHPDGFAVALVGLGGTVVAHQTAQGLVHGDPARAFRPVAEAAAALLAASGRRCVGAAAALPTAVTRPGGTAVRALYVGWPDGAPVRDLLAAELARCGVPGSAARSSTTSTPLPWPSTGTVRAATPATCSSSRPSTAASAARSCRTAPSTRGAAASPWKQAT